jgi:TatD DNase family protein
MFVDSHCHLEFPELRADLDGVIERARAAGIGRIVTIGTRKSGFDDLLEITRAYDEVYCTAGVHPHEAAQPEEQITAAELVAMTKKPKVVGIGESGLDYFYDHAPREAQQKMFREHIRAALETGLPLSIHTRDAEEDTLALLREEIANAGEGANLKAILHCFSSRRFLAEEALKMGLYISVSGIATFKKSEELRAILRDVPMDRLLIETDSPYLAPVPLRGKTCEPSYVVHTARTLAEIKNVSIDQIAAQTTENFFRLFSKVAQ